MKAGRRGGRVRGRDASQAQFTGQPILQGAHSAEVLQHAAEMGGLPGAVEFFGEGPMPIVAHEDIEPIAIDRHRQAVRDEHLAKGVV